MKQAPTGWESCLVELVYCSSIVKFPSVSRMLPRKWADGPLSFETKRSAEMTGPTKEEEGYDWYRSWLPAPLLLDVGLEPSNCQFD